MNIAITCANGVVARWVEEENERLSAEVKPIVENEVRALANSPDFVSDRLIAVAGVDFDDFKDVGDRDFRTDRVINHPILGDILRTPLAQYHLPIDNGIGYLSDGAVAFLTVFIKTMQLLTKVILIAETEARAFAKSPDLTNDVVIGLIRVRSGDLKEYGDSDYSTERVSKYLFLGGILRALLAKCNFPIDNGAGHLPSAAAVFITVFIKTLRKCLKL